MERRRGICFKVYKAILEGLYRKRMG